MECLAKGFESDNVGKNEFCTTSGKMNFVPLTENEGCDSICALANDVNNKAEQKEGEHAKG